MGKIIFNGEMKNRSDIRVDVEDRGYQFGDGVYEVIRVYNGKLFAGDMHLERLMDSAREIELKMPFTVEELKDQAIRLIEENGLDCGTIYMQVTRGASPRDHAFPDGVDPVFIAYTKEAAYPGEMKPGVKAVTTEDLRWLRCNIKSLNLLGNILAKQQAVKAGCAEAIQHRGDTVTEGSSSNVAIVTGGVLKTHPATNLILNGITRRIMLQLCKENGISFSEEPFTVAEMKSADEVLYSSTSVEITPIINIDGQPVGNGVPGPVTQKLEQLFAEEIDRQCGTL